MKPSRLFLLASLLPVAPTLAAEPPQTSTARTQIQAEQGKKQALADVIWQYLKAEPARKRQLDDAADRLYGLALKEDGAADKLPDTLFVAPWQEALAPLRNLALAAPAAKELKAMEDALKETVRLLSTVPSNAVAATAAAAAVPAERAAVERQALRRLERKQALLAAAPGLLGLKQQAARLDEQLEAEARRFASGARLLADQALMQPTPGKGEKP
ncbi:MAG: hypothetical protein PHU46_06100 [Rhodocyclaceae bacterium]|nr:hypothetical protein [Rhodocyclaceae bacterium]